MTSRGMDADELRMLSETMAKVLADTERAKLISTLGELGWFELWRERPGAAAHALFGQQGRLARTSPALTLLMGTVAGVPHAEPSAGPPVLLPDTAGFDRGGWVAAGQNGGLTALAQRDALDGVSHAVLPAEVDGEHRLLLVEVAALRSSLVDGLDPDLALCRVDAADAARSAETLAAGPAAEKSWAGAVALGRRLLAEEMVGVVAEQQRLAGEHVKARQQFGRPIGSFQAVKHKLAEVYVALTSAELAAEEAWLAPDPTSSLLAKLLATQAVEAAGVHCQQVLGGIGFTWEHRFHWYLRRGRLLAALLGGRAQLARELGGGIVASGAVPVLAPL